MKGKKWLAALLALMFLLCLVPAYALAEENPKEITNEEGSTIYNAGDIVFNNGGTVYNNSGIVYNNGGTVYNNGGIAYNNAGIVYNNGGEVFNNSGTVYHNSGVVHNNDGTVEAGDGQTEAENAQAAAGQESGFGFETADDYSVYADIEGLNTNKESGALSIAKDSVCTISPKEGFIISEASSSAGKITENEDGTYTLSEVDADVLLTLSFKIAAPKLSYESGTYGGALTVELSALPDADIYYTLNSDAPTADSESYKSAIEIKQGTVLNAIAIFDGIESDVASAAYAIPTVTAPEFDVVKLGYKQPKAQGIVVENAGEADAVITGVALSGESVDSFILSTVEGATIKAGATDDSTWTLRPAKYLKSGVYTVKVTVSYDSGDSAELFVGFKVTE